MGTITGEFHPIANCFPMMSDAEIDALGADIKAHGMHYPIMLFDEKILDGRNRWEAAKRVGVEVTNWETYTGKDPVAFVVSLNDKRRHLKAGQRAAAAAKLAKLGKGRPKKTPSAEGVSQAVAAKMLDVSVASVERATAVAKNGAPELIAAVERGDVAVTTAAAIATLPKAQQREAVEGGKKAMRRAAKAVHAKNKPRKPKAAIAGAPAFAPPSEPIAAPQNAPEAFRPDPVSDCIVAVQRAIEVAIWSRLSPVNCEALFNGIRDLIKQLEEQAQRFNQEAA